MTYILLNERVAQTVKKLHIHAKILHGSKRSRIPFFESNAYSAKWGSWKLVSRYDQGKLTASALD